MPDTIGYIRPSSPLTIHLRIRRLLDSTGAAAIDVSKIETDVAVANTIWDQADVNLVIDSIEDWENDTYFSMQQGEFRDLQEVHWQYGQTWINVYYVEDWAGGVAGACSFPNHEKPHAIALEDAPAGMNPADVDDWRGIALAHELGHYLSLAHTHQDNLPDTDSTGTLDPGNVMTTGGRGRTTVISDIHLTQSQIDRARDACFMDRANLIAPTLAAALG